MPVMAGEKTETIVVNGVERTYLAVVPASLDGNVPAPVLLGFHGGQGTSEYAYQAYGLAGDEAMLYVFPQAPFWPEAGGVAWNVDPNGVDFPYFDAMLADIAKKYCIDPARVFAAGQSNGAFFVNALACYRPSAVRAVAPAAGGGPPGQCEKSTVTAMIIHGTNDNTVPVSSGKFARDYWLQANGCAGAQSAPADPAPCVSYVGCAEPVLWCEHGGGHPWPDFAGPAIRKFFLSL
jgi:polyhydroxybutyrate depolymerase